MLNGSWCGVFAIVDYCCCCCFAIYEVRYFVFNKIIAGLLEIMPQD